MDSKSDCYCKERSNPKMHEFFDAIPDGYCGICDICQEYGHTRAHPYAPTTGTWCDRHYQEIIDGDIIGLASIVNIIIYLIMIISLLFVAYSWI